MTYTLGTAAKATGKSKSTISRDIKEGRISATKLDNGSFVIDPAELHRVYPAVSAGTGLRNSQKNDTEPLGNTTGTGGDTGEVERLREQLVKEQAERDRERRQLEDQVADLRHRLDSEGEERRKLTAILTDQRAGPAVGLFGRLFGRKG